MCNEKSEKLFVIQIENKYCGIDRIGSTDQKRIK